MEDMTPAVATNAGDTRQTVTGQNQSWGTFRKARRSFWPCVPPHFCTVAQFYLSRAMPLDP
jgi:hypothetical protein